uniref:Ycf36 n=1 Tax=Schimmelmannia schousboei TaxID=173468 RepID=A0A1C9C8I9_9FLOR|nr:hypothetical protein Schim_017 [Schimmelmannia schousboei]AOM64698.1 hypothetical protein Schim_017 [Schimmelmannia schousboei]
MCISNSFCPVPFDQQPLNEYFSLKTSFFFSWSTLQIRKYINRLISIFCFLVIIFSPLILAIIPNNQNIIKSVILDLMIVDVIFIFVFIRLYLGWSYVIKRLVSATIFYEESGWYDGQIWVKTTESLTKDRLVGLYEVTPFIKRVKYTFFMFIFLFIVENVVFYLL